MKILASFVLLCSSAFAQTVRFETSLGNIDVELLPQSAPLTVANFLKYVERNAYNSSFFHRSVAGFIIQGGGFRWESGQPREIPADGTVRNEYRLSNTRGTIAMAKLGNDPNSATTQWFFNLANNAANLNNQNGGFTVFGRVVDSAGLSVMDRIAAVPVANAGSPFDQIPIRDYRGGNITEANLVMVSSIRVLDNRPAVGNNGVVSAGQFGGFAYAAPGSWIETYGSDLSGSTRTWAADDFTGGVAPVSLGDVSVTIDNKAAFVSYVSPTQVNVQVPADVALDTTVPVIVTRSGQASAPSSLAIRRAAPGLLAPASFKYDDRQFAGAPARQGDIITLFGVGFGPVSGTDVAGRIASGLNPLTSRVEFFFGDTPAEVRYAGLAPDFVGLYQFNVLVPPGATPGDMRLRVTVDGQDIPQELWFTVQAR